MKDFYWWAKSIQMLQKALTQIKKKISCASGKLGKGLIVWVLQMLLAKLHALP